MRKPSNPTKEDQTRKEPPPLPDRANSDTTKPCAARDQQPKQQHLPNRRPDSPTSPDADQATSASAWKTVALHGQARHSQTQIHQHQALAKKDLAGTARVQKAVFFLGGISPDCELDSVQKYCKERNVRVASCRFIPTRVFGTKAARLCVSAADAQAQGVNNNNFWPEHMTIRRWNFAGETIQSNDQ